MSQVLSSSQLKYYRRLDRLFALTTCLVLIILWIGGYFIPVPTDQRFAFEVYVLLGALFSLYRYGFWSNKDYTPWRYYATELVNTTLIGMLMLTAGTYGLFFLVLFLLHIVGTGAILRLRHLAFSLILSLGWLLYVFAFTNTFGLTDLSRWLTGSIFAITLLGMALFNFLIIWEVIRLFLDLEKQKEQFIQDASHELRTPLTVIKAAAEILTDPSWIKKMMNQGNKQQEEIAKHLESATQDLEHIAEKLSDSNKNMLENSRTKPARRQKRSTTT